jgi:hypothetical protein
LPLGRVEPFGERSAEYSGEIHRMGRILKTGASLVIGLTLAATAAVSTIPAEAATRWRAAGVKLPHSAGKQYRIGKKISKSQLRNGDLVFFYRGISHVGLYAGNG